LHPLILRRSSNRQRSDCNPTAHPPPPSLAEKTRSFYTNVFPPGSLSGFIIRTSN
jgi:hypothetical protein